jgi:hypothetical protein
MPLTFRTIKMNINPNRFGLPTWIQPNQAQSFWNALLNGASNSSAGGSPTGGGVSANANSTGVAYPYGPPRAPVVPLNTPEMQRADDAQYVKFNNRPGVDPYVDANRRVVQQQLSTAVPPETAARAYASHMSGGSGLQWDSLRNGWAAPPAQNTMDWNTKIGDFYRLLKEAQQPAPTPALNLFNQRFGNQQQPNVWG